MARIYKGNISRKSDLQETSNFFGHSRKLKQSWYDGTTQIKPLDDAISYKILDTRIT